MFDSKSIPGVKALCAAAIGIAALATSAPSFAQANEQFVSRCCRSASGPYGPAGVGIFGGFIDYMNYINVKEGGVGGVKLSWEECETEYAAAHGVECYERLKTQEPDEGHDDQPGLDADHLRAARQDGGRQGAAGADRLRPHRHDRRALLPVGLPADHDVSDAGDGDRQVPRRTKEKGNLRGKKIAYLYLDSAYGKEPITYLQAEAKVNGFELTTIPITPPGTEQGAQWQQIRQFAAPTT